MKPSIPRAWLFLLLGLGLSVLLLDLEARASAAPPPDLTVGGSKIQMLTEDTQVGNLTLRKEATLVVKGCELVVNGTLRMSGESRLMVVGGEVNVFPGPQPVDVIPVQLTDQSMLQLERDERNQPSRVHFFPQPTHTDVPFINLQDRSKLNVLESTFIADLPAVPFPDSVTETPVVAGVILLEGDSVWHSKKAKLVGNLALTENDDLLGRWYWASIQQRGVIEITSNTTVNLKNAESYPVFKPVAGTFLLKDSEILKGLMELEVINRATFINSKLNYGLSVGDMAELEVNDVLIDASVSMGAPDPKAPPGIESMARISGKQLNITGTLTLASLSSVALTDSIISQISCNNESHFRLDGGDIYSLRLYAQGSAIVSNASLDRASLYSHGSLELRHPTKEVFRFFINGTEPSLYMRDGEVEQINFYPDQAVNITLNDATIQKIYVYGEAKLNLKLQKGSHLGELTGRPVPFQLDLLDEGSTYLPLNESDLNLTYQVYHSLSCSTISQTPFQDLPVAAKISIADKNGPVLEGTAEEGLYFTRLPRDPERELNITVSYLGFVEFLEIKLERSHEFDIRWRDPISPTISSPRLSPANWNLQDPLTIEVTVLDEGIQALQKVVLRYRIDNGPWLTLDMFPLGDDKYAAQIPGQERNVRIEYYVNATDMAGNLASTDDSIETITVGSQESWMLRLSVLATLFSIVFFTGRFLWQRYYISQAVGKEGS